jgi:hypothetical protein
MSPVRAREVSGNRGSRPRFWNASPPNRTCACAISARRNARTARSIRSSARWNAPPDWHSDKPQAKLDKLDAVLAQTSTSTEDSALFAEMLSLPNDGRYPALELAPEQRRKRTLEALTSVDASTSSGCAKGMRNSEDTDCARRPSIRFAQVGSYPRPRSVNGDLLDLNVFALDLSCGLSAQIDVEGSKTPTRNQHRHGAPRITPLVDIAMTNPAASPGHIHDWARASTTIVRVSAAAALWARQKRRKRRPC